MRRMQSVALVALLALAPVVSAAELGRMFFTPAQRATLDNARKQNIRAEISNEGEQPAATASIPQSVSVNGLIKRSDGKNTVWINNRAVTENQPGAISAVVGKTDNRVQLNVPESGRKLDLKVGQSVEIVSGTIEESYLRRPPAKSEAKASSETEKTPGDVAKVTPPPSRDAVKSEPALQRRQARGDGDPREDARPDDRPGRN